MNDQGFPGQHTTTTSVSQTAVTPVIRFDSSYIRTVPGLIKIALILLNFIGFICIEVSGSSYDSRGSYFNTIAMTGFWFTGIMLIFYLFHICEKLYRIPWLKIEMWFCLILTILNLFAASFAVAKQNEAYSAAAFFGYCAMCLYGYDTFLKFKAVRAGAIAQGTRTVQQQQTTVTIS